MIRRLLQRWYEWLPLVIGAAIVLWLVIWINGCASSSWFKVQGGDTTATETITTTTEQPDGTVITVVEQRKAFAQQPENPQDGATARAGQAQAGIKGGSVVPDPSLIMQTATLTWIGAVLIIVGIGSFALRFTSPVVAKLIPWTGSAAAIVAGAVFLSWPRIGGMVAIVVLLGAVALVVGFVYWNGWGLNHFKKKANGG